MKTYCIIYVQSCTYSMDCVNNVDFQQVVVQDVQNVQAVRMGVQEDHLGVQVVEDKQLAVQVDSQDNIQDNSLPAWDGGN